MKKQTETKSKYCGIALFFLAVMVLFTAVNAWEFLSRSDSDGRMAGLNHLDSMEGSAINLWGEIQNMMGKQRAFGTTTYEDVTLLSNGYATMTDANPEYQAAITGTLKAADLADEIGADFLYVQAPSKQRYASDLPSGAICYCAEKCEQVVATLQQDEIQVIDMREVLEETGEDWWSFFYQSDHHWNNRAAFLAYQQICGYLNECGYRMNESYLDPSMYSKRTYEDVFLGTHGRMAGRYYAGLDDYELWLPNFDTRFTLSVASQGIDLEGDFETCFVHYENLDHYSFDYYAYYAYLKEDFDCFEIVNELNPDGPHVVIVRDSEAVPVSVFLASQCSEVDIVDLRYCTDLDAEEYIREQQPDVLIYLFGPGYLANENAMVL